jgi:hypothetical protein
MSVALLLFVATLQTTINGSLSPYTTDTGEIQNALPRWGTIHWTGYPQYSITGSFLVSALHLGGITPATGASLVSALWGTLAVGLLICLARDLGAVMPAAVAGGWFFAIATSVWIDASLAEVHTLTLVLTLASLWFGLRFGRTGRKRDLLWLTFVFTQGVVHQRAILFLAPALLLFVVPYWRTIWHRLLAVIGVAVLAPLTYLYLPLRVWMGADWTFGPVGSLRGLWGMLTDNRAERVVEVPLGPAQWWERFKIVLDILDYDLPWPLLAIGLTALLIILWSRNRREATALTLSWLPYLGLSMLIWIGRVGDAILAAKLPIIALATAGLALTLDWTHQRVTISPRSSMLRWTGTALLALILVALSWNHYFEVIEITRDPSAEQIITTAARALPALDERPTTLMALWGRDFWVLAYAQRYQDRLSGLDIVDHNANFRELLAQGQRLWVLGNTFYLRPVSWWQDRLDSPIALSSVAPGIIEISTSPHTELAHRESDFEPLMDLENGIQIVDAKLEWSSPAQLLLEIIWQARRTPTTNYSVAVHLVSHNPPRGAQDILIQADRKHPVNGWYPTSHWTAGEYVVGHYLIAAPHNSPMTAVRIALYHQKEDGTFENSPWLSLPIPSRTGDTDHS